MPRLITTGSYQCPGALGYNPLPTRNHSPPPWNTCWGESKRKENGGERIGVFGGDARSGVVCCYSAACSSFRSLFVVRIKCMHVCGDNLRGEFLFTVCVCVCVCVCVRTMICTRQNLATHLHVDWV